MPDPQIRKPMDLVRGDVFRLRGVDYRVACAPVMGKYGVVRVFARRVAIEEVGLDFDEEVRLRGRRAVSDA